MLDTPDAPQAPGFPAPPPQFGQSAGPKKPKQQARPTFMGGQDQPQANVGGKTLMGQ